MMATMGSCWRRCVVLLLLLAPVWAGALAPGTHRIEVAHDGRTRHALVHVPANVKPRPALVLAFHGGGGHADLMARDRLYGLTAQSERSADVLVFPNGFSRLPGDRFATWNAGLCCGQAQERGIDDVGFVRALLAELRQRVAFDERRVYVIGMSNGAMLAHRLACELPGTFAAIGAVAGTDGTPDCVPAKPVAVLQIHARDDDHVAFNGGPGPSSRVKVDFVSVPDTVAKWVRANACTQPPQRVLSVPGARCERHAGCAGGVEVQLCVTDSGGHSWPGGRKAIGGAPGSDALSANAVIWDFFARHPGAR
jgi:polyhydroxybutyrate depolymerase